MINPTRVVFGDGTIAALPRLIPKDASVMVFYGGGSIKRNGVYDQVVVALAGYTLTEFGGVEANPRYETILRAAAQARRDGVDFVLAVGGGSVIDAAKFLVSAIIADDPDPWDAFFANRYPERIVPVGCVLTLPATASESNSVAVISSIERSLKYPFNREASRPIFAIMDPSTMASLDRRQLSNGAVDAFTHVIEQYLTLPDILPIQHGYSEVLLRTLIEWGPRLVADNSPAAREIVMWTANQALNGLIGAGVEQDWSSHYIGHAITALYDIDHARTLTLVMPSLLRLKRETKLAMLARYARNVWHIEESDDRRAADLAIDHTEGFFRAMDMPVRVADVAPIVISADAINNHLAQVGHTALGERKDIGPADVDRIIAMAA
ncbi:MAG: iron-containing alcohol dehydrogenase [Sphingopyxis terrae]|nr:MAG: iron-containing alcohol dehydrogenase [Sphingopyxis terrae]